MSANNTLPVDNVREIPQDNLSFYLAGVEMGAQMAFRNVRYLPRRPSFETMAEYELEQTRKALEDALQTITEAQAAYQSLPVEA